MGDVGIPYSPYYLRIITRPSTWLSEFLRRLLPADGGDTCAAVQLVRQLFGRLAAVPWGPLPLFWLTRALLGRYGIP